MKLRPYSRSLKTRVPVSMAEDRSPEQVSHPGPVGLNKRHEDHLISFLQAHYGWYLGDDGNLYSPNPEVSHGGSSAA